MKIFIVEDDIWYGEILEYHISLNPDYEVERFKNGKDFLKNLYKNPDVVTLDYSLPDLECKEILDQIWKSKPGLPVIIVSGQEDIRTAVNLLKRGVYDYVVKDEDAKDRVWNTLKNVQENVKLKNEISQLKQEITQKYNFEKTIKGNSPALKKVFALIEKASKTNINVSITGETGTGKELAAKAIHYNSDRRMEPFVALNVAAIPSELIESELFGHEKGAFTGASARRIGSFESANRGTLFLDEIADMDISTQTKLLRVLQEKELVRIGGNKKIKLDVRVIIATHKNVSEEVKKGNFREDLYFRVLGLPVEMPPLRNRGNDVLLLAKFFTNDFCKENKIKSKSISPEAQAKLMSYHFPGNVRELKAIMELAVVLADGDAIDADSVRFNSPKPEEDFLKKETTMREYEIKILKYYMDKYDKNIPLIAEKLDIGKSTIYRMMKEF